MVTLDFWVPSHCSGTFIIYPTFTKGSGPYFPPHHLTNFLTSDLSWNLANYSIVTQVEDLLASETARPRKGYELTSVK